MRNIIAFIVLSIITTLATAGNAYCDGRKTQTEVERCYVSAVQMQFAQINNITKQIYASPKLSDDDKMQFSNDLSAWVKFVENTCQNNVCMYNETVSCRNRVAQYYNEYVK